MSKALHLFKGESKEAAIKRRIKSGSLGLAFWGAYDALRLRVKYQLEFTKEEAEALLAEASKVIEASKGSHKRGMA